MLISKGTNREYLKQYGQALKGVLPSRTGARMTVRKKGVNEFELHYSVYEIDSYENGIIEAFKQAVLFMNSFIFFGGKS